MQSYLLNAADAQRSQHSQAVISRIVRRLQQLSGPVMAKNLEAPLFYRDARFVALNDVGGDPQHFGTDIDAFHSFNAERSLHNPHALTATATHGTKRGENVRARLFAFSRRPDSWKSVANAAQEIAFDARQNR